MQIPWYLAALGAALTWGVHYPLVGFALTRISLFSVLLISVLPIFLLVPFYFNQVASDVGTLQQLPAREQMMIMVIGITSLLGAAFVFLAIGSKNATLASLIEITYPVFVAFFSYVIFKHVHVNASVILGAVMVMAGATLIIVNNQ